MAILSDLQALFAQCPVLQEFAPRTDQLETDAEGYAILPTGSAELTRDMTGSVTYQYHFVIAATRISADDAMRLDNCNFLERLQNWVQDQDVYKRQVQGPHRRGTGRRQAGQWRAAQQPHSSAAVERGV